MTDSWKDAIDYPVSWDFWRAWCRKHGEDPGPCEPEEDSGFQTLEQRLQALEMLLGSELVDAELMGKLIDVALGLLGKQPHYRPQKREFLWEKLQEQDGKLQYTLNKLNEHIDRTKRRSSALY